MKGLLSSRCWPSILAAALLAACAVSQPPIGAPQTSAIATHADRIGLAQKAASSGDLLYVSQHLDSGWDVVVLTYPQGKQLGKITKINEPWWGLCSDSSGNVWVPTSDGIYEFAHGGTLPIKTLSPPGFTASACSVDPNTGSLAVVGGDSSGPLVDIWPAGASGSPTQYIPSFEPIFVGYDDNSNLFIDGITPYKEFLFAELQSGGSGFTDITLNEPAKYTGPVLWDGQYITVGTINTSAPKGARKVIYRVKVSGTQGTVVGTTTFRRMFTGGYGYWFQGNHLIGPAPGGIGVWAYPKGGWSLAKIKGFAPWGITVSVPPSGSHERR